MITQVADFHRLESRLRMTGSLITRTALRIGAGDGEAVGVDLPVIKDALGQPFIPGASLKGALRSTIEALVRGADRGGEIWACDPLARKDDESRGAERSSARTGAPSRHRVRPSTSCGFHKPGERGAVKLEEHCTVCRMFGSHVVASHIRFCDALLCRKTDRIPVEVRDGVSIDRDLRRVQGSLKYDFEVVAPGAEFAVEVFVENPQPWWMGLLAVGFDQLAEGFTALGGFTSRGLGRVAFIWSSIKVTTARGLLRGERDEDLTGEQVAARFQDWRGALTELCKEAV
ncbi:MAG TPA: CRISPR-associated RAMP protein Csx7 [Kofleriaceae bacterium]|nr:CRISPR-associated RAMP protein Csx7 [Kofleriaceae bacterium]